MPTVSDYLLKSVSSVVQSGVWVRLTNNASALTYFSTGATDGNGEFTYTAPPGIYTIATGLSSTGPWVDTGDTNYVVSDPMGQHNQQTVTETVLVSGVDSTKGEDVLCTLTASRVIGKPLNGVAGQRLHLLLTQGGAGGFAATFGAGVVATNWTMNTALGSVTEAWLTCLSPTSWVLASNPPSGAVTVAAPTGVSATDDASVAAAYALLPAAGGVLYFTWPGTYILSAIVISKANTTIYVAQGVTLKLKNNANVNFLAIQASGCRVTGGGIIDGNKANNATNGTGIEVGPTAGQTVENVTVEGMFIQNTTLDGIRIEIGPGSTIRRCMVRNNYISNCGNGSTQASGIALARVLDSIIDSNIVINVANHGIVSTQGSRNTISRNTIIGTGISFSSGFAHGIAVDGNGGANPDANLRVEGNFIQNAWMAGIELADGVDHCVVANNNILTTGLAGSGNRYGIYFGGSISNLSDGCSIIGNCVDAAGANGIELNAPAVGSHCKGATVSGNVVRNCQQNGIYAQWFDQFSITGNVCYNNSQSGAGNYDGIRLNTTGATGLGGVVVGNRCWDDQGTQTQNNGLVVITSAWDVLIGLNQVEGNKAGGSGYAGMALLLGTSTVLDQTAGGLALGLSPGQALLTRQLGANADLIIRNQGTNPIRIRPNDTGANDTIFYNNGHIDVSGNLKVIGNVGFYNTTPVARPTGWVAATGTPTRSTFVTSSVTLPVLAEHVKALMDDLLAEGLIGP